MEIKEIIRKVYEKGGVQVDDDYIEYKMKDREKVKQFMKIYRQEEIDSMNYILGKPKNNLIFKIEELELCHKINLFDRKTIEICKSIYERESKGVNA